MAVRLAVDVAVKAVTVVCGACGTTEQLRIGDDCETVRAWARAHHDPRLTGLCSSINGGPLSVHTFARPRMLR